MNAAVLQDAQAFFRRRVHSSWVFAALQERKLAGSIRDAGVGYAPRGDALCTHLMERGHSPSEIVASGIARDMGGRIAPLLWDRLTIPVHSTDGQLVGFTGRAPASVADAPKYVSTIYAKRQTVYGLWEAREALQSGAWPVVVEGVMDVWAVRIVAAKADLPLAPMAVCGTAFTREHVLEIADVTRKPLTFMFDGDAAGSKALIRAWETATDARPGVSHRALVLPSGADPADLWANSPRLLRRILAAPQPAAHRVAELRVAGTRHARETPFTKVAIARGLGADMARLPAHDVA